MAKAFRSGDAKLLLEKHQKLAQRLAEAAGQAEKKRTAVRSAAEALAAQEAVRMLKDIPVEELNREKKGYRVKSLRDNGYESIADLAKASEMAITAVNGIGPETARAIKQSVTAIVERTQKGAKIRLSADNKTKEATALVTAISGFLATRTSTEGCLRLQERYGREIPGHMAQLKAAAGSLKWLFAGSEKKQKAEASYGRLEELLNGEYGTQGEAILAEYDRQKLQLGGKPWDEYTAAPVQFINALEEIAPDLLGNDDLVYGLPENLAQEIAEEPFYPEGLQCQLRRYQEWGVKYALHQKRVLLGDEMGLGKTVQAIAVMVSLRNTGASHFMVVCPASVITNWCREIAKMSDLEVTRIHGADRKNQLQFWLENGGVAVTTFETTAFIELSEKYHFSTLVVDEAHYIKNPGAQRSKNVRRISEHAERLLFMTGTALENRVDEMIELIRILQQPIAMSVQAMAYLSSAPQFREEIAPVYYRRKREDVLTELPELTEMLEWCTLSGKEEALYEAAVLSKNYPAARRVSWNVEDVKDSSKAARLAEIVEQAAEEGRKVLVFSFFLDTIRKVTTLLGERCMEPINGSISPQRRQEIIDEFDKAPAGSVLAAQIQSGGTGLNIQSASVVVLCEPQFKPSIENQAIARAYRMGQTRNVLVYRLLCDDTVDEKIMETLASKQKVFDAFADQSVVAEESFELDERSFGQIMQEEAARIQAKNGETEAPAEAAAEAPSEVTEKTE